MLQNAYFVAKIGADTAKNEQRFAERLSARREAVREDAHARAQRPGPADPLAGLGDAF